MFIQHPNHKCQFLMIDPVVRFALKGSAPRGFFEAARPPRWVVMYFRSSGVLPIYRNTLLQASKGSHVCFRSVVHKHFGDDTFFGLANIIFRVLWGLLKFVFQFLVGSRGKWHKKKVFLFPVKYGRFSSTFGKFSDFLTDHSNTELSSMQILYSP